MSVVQLKVTLPSDHSRKTDTVLEGRRYKLRAEVLDHDRKIFSNFTLWIRYLACLNVSYDIPIYISFVYMSNSIRFLLSGTFLS